MVLSFNRERESSITCLISPRSIPNLIALLLLSGTVVNLTKEFFASEKANG